MMEEKSPRICISLRALHRALLATHLTAEDTEVTKNSQKDSVVILPHKVDCEKL